MFGEANTLVDEYSEAYPSTMANGDLKVLWNLLYGRHGNDGIRSSDVARWKMQLFNVIYSYGPTWSKRKSIQSRLRQMDDAAFREGNVSIHNNAVNPSTGPSTTEFQPLPYVNNQTAAGTTKPLVEALLSQAQYLDDTLDEAFLAHFDGLFTVFGGKPTIFWTEE